MKKLAAIALSVCAMNAISWALTFPFEVPTPLLRQIALGKATEMNLIFPPSEPENADDVYFTYISKEPSDTAPIMALVPSYGHEILPDSAFWTNERNNKKYFYQPLYDALVSGYSGDWVKLRGMGCKGDEPGWVMTKHCIIRNPLPIPDEIKTGNFDELYPLKVPKGTEGKYALFANWHNSDGVVDFLVGRFKDGVLVCPYGVSAYFDETNEFERGFYNCHDDDEEGDFTIFAYYGEDERNLHTFPKKWINLLLNSVIEIPPVNVYLYKDGREMSGNYKFKLAPNTPD